jgi:hypothetical protein
MLQLRMFFQRFNNESKSFWVYFKTVAFSLKTSHEQATSTPHKSSVLNRISFYMTAYLGRIIDDALV